MGLFNKTEEELRQEEENRKWSNLINSIWESSLEEDQKRVLLDYANKVRKGYPNDFENVDILMRVFEKLLNSNFLDVDDFEEHFQDVIDSYHMIVNHSDEGVDRIRERFIEDFVGDNGCLYLDIHDEGMYGLFHNKEDYFEIMDVIGSDDIYIEHFQVILEYIMRVSKYCLNQDILKRDVLSYLDGFLDVLDEDYESYSNQQVEEAKKRIGVYSISPKELAIVDSKLQKMDDYFDQFGISIRQLEEDRKAISSLIENGKKDIQSQEKASMDHLKRLIDHQKKALMEKLDQYLLDLEETLKNKSDETFRQIIQSYQSQVQEFRNLFKGYSAATSKDLLEIQRATEDSVKRLQAYVTNEPQLRELLQKAQEQNVVREKIIELVGKEEELLKAEKVVAKEEVTIPGYEKRIMVPYRHMVLPSEISSDINPFLNENIPFSRRKEEFLKRLEEREKNGEIFHKKIPQIAIDVMEGDWPYLWGPSGTGKSYMAKQIASLLGMELTKAGKITEPYSILGYNDPQGRYQITPSFIAALYGNLLFLDEMDNGNPDTQVVLNDIYSELLNKMDNPDEHCDITFGTDIQVDVHPNFRMISAGNTSGEGENEAFSSRGKMDESIQERMTPIFIDYDNRVEERILKDYPQWYKFFIDFRNACMDYARGIGLDSAQGITTTRDAAAIKKYIAHNSKSIDQVLAERFIQIKDSEYRKALGHAIADIYGINYDSCEDVAFNKKLASADGKVLAKKFVYACKKGVD